MKRGLLTSVFCGVLLCARADITIQVIAIAATGTFVQADGSALADGSVARVGYFDESGLAGLDASGLRDFATVDALFTEVTTFSSASGNIQANTNVSVATAGGTGRQIYLWVFNGSQPATASQSGIFTDPGWTVPSEFGSLNMVSQSIDAEDIVLGTLQSGSFALVEMGGGSGARDFTGLVGATANGDGTYTSSWFGSYRDLGSGWVDHATSGLLFAGPITTDADIYLYSFALGEWVWTRRSAWPGLFAFNSASWMHVIERNGTAYRFDYATRTWQW